MGKKRPRTLKTRTHRVRTGCGNIYITISEEDYPEVRAEIGKSGTCAKALMQSLALVISFALQHGADPLKIAKYLKGMQCSTSNPVLGIPSCPEAIGTALEERYKRDGEGD